MNVLALVNPGGLPRGCTLKFMKPARLLMRFNRLYCHFFLDMVFGD